jgi:hypothetical protein
MYFIVLANLDFAPLGKGVYNGRANSVEAAGERERFIVEFTAGMQYGHDYF